MQEHDNNQGHSATGDRDGSHKKTETSPFNAAMVIIDDTTWLWGMTERALSGINMKFAKLPSNIMLRHSWSRFHDSPFIIIHWEGKSRGGGAIVEEILEIDKRFDAAERLIIITTNPIHEDVVYFSELGIRRVIKARHRDQDVQVSIKELQNHVREIMSPPAKTPADALWRKILVAIDRLPDNPPEGILTKIETSVHKLRDNTKGPTARDLEALASVNLRRGKTDEALRQLKDAISVNPNYFRAWNTLIAVKRQLGQHMEAYALLQKMQMHNRSSIRRLVAMGEEQLALNDHEKAERYFKSALDKDAWCSPALNGMAEVRFAQDELDQARGFLEKSSLAYKFASKLNLTGVELVKAGDYAHALEHYSKAQYVLPQGEKGPQLLYNIALCYAKWGRFSMADEFLKLAIIKEPNYKKASKLLEIVRAKNPDATKHEVDAA